MLSIRVLASLFLAFSWSADSYATQKLEQVTVLTEEWKPFNFEFDNKIRGISTDLVVLALDASKLSYELKLQPWQRAYHTTLNKPNTFLFTTNRTPSRENLFKWIGPLIIQDMTYFTLSERDDVVVTTLSKLKNYKLGAARGGSVHNYLKEQGFAVGKELETYTTELQAVRMLESGRVDMIPGSSITRYSLEKLLKKGKLKKVYTLRVGEYYIAANLETPDKIVSRMQQELDKLIDAGERERLIKEYQSDKY